MPTALPAPGDMARVTLRDSRSDTSQCEVEVALARLPEALEAALHTDESGAVDGTGAAAGGAAGGGGPRVALVLVLGKEAANRMLRHVPKVGPSVGVYTPLLTVKTSSCRTSKPTGGQLLFLLNLLAETRCVPESYALRSCYLPVLTAAATRRADGSH